MPLTEALIQQLPKPHAERTNGLLRDPQIDPVVDLGAITKTSKNCRFQMNGMGA